MSVAVVSLSSNCNFNLLNFENGGKYSQLNRILLATIKLRFRLNFTLVSMFLFALFLLVFERANPQPEQLNSSFVHSSYLATFEFQMDAY
jgi:hypothetical protein